MKYLIQYLLPNETVDHVISAKDEHTLSVYIELLVNEGAYNIEVEPQNNKK